MKGQVELKQYFGYDTYRPGQEEVVSAILSGQDALCIMPTGAGKSLCYQIPALMMDGITLVVSPLVSLMKDQVGHLINSGVKAAYINSSLTQGQIRTAMSRAKAGMYKIIYVAPERLLLPFFLDFAVNAIVSMVTVDEAHCVSQWGHDFRESYLDIAPFISMLPARPVVTAFTATATERVREDILKLLDLEDPFRLVTGFNRQNLYFSVEHPKTKMGFLLAFLENQRASSSIVYCSTRKTVEEVCEGLQKEGFSATRYHAGLEPYERHQNQEDFVYDRKKIMVATNAFGMGIDKSDVRNVVHYNMPKNLESYYQEAGRAGRDGERADCVLLYSPQDVRTAQFLIKMNDDGERDPKAIESDLKLLAKMERYCKIQTCLRHYILQYFGESAPGACGDCGNCNANYEQVDVTQEAGYIISCIRSLQKQRRFFGKTMIANILKGSRDQKLLLLSLDKNPEYGKLKKHTARYIQDIIEFLIGQGYLMVSSGDYPTITLAKQAVKEEDQSQTISMPVQHKRREASTQEADGAMDSQLLQRLKALRTKISLEERVPAYVVFNDKTLKEMAIKSPQTLHDFSQISGVGKRKLDKYGERFMRVLRGEEAQEDLKVEEIEIEHKNASQPWSSEEDQKLRQRYEDIGLSILQLSELHGRTRGAILSRLKKLGIIES